MTSKATEVEALAAFVNVAQVDPPQARHIVAQLPLTPSDFAAAWCGKAWGAFALAVGEKRELDLHDIAHVTGLTREQLAPVFNGDTLATTAHARLAVVLDTAKRRRAVSALRAAAGVINDTTQPFGAGLDEAHKALEAIAASLSAVRTLDADVLKLMDHLREAEQGRREPAIRTGIEGWDKATGGLQRTLTVLGAMPRVGKSAVLASVIRNLSKRGVKTGLISLEDEAVWVPERLISEASKVSVFTLATGRLNEYQQDNVASAAAEVYDLARNVSVVDKPAMTTADVVAAAREMILVHGAQAVFVDHLGEIRINRSDRHDLDIISALQDLRAISKTYDVPVVVLCHVRRRDGLSESVEPRLTDFAFSAGLERMARVGMVLWKPAKDTLRCSVLKQTRGKPKVYFDLEWRGPSGTVGNDSMGEGESTGD